MKDSSNELSSEETERAVLAVDPGREKCGLALIWPGGAAPLREIVARTDLVTSVSRWMARSPRAILIIGSGTGSRDAVEALTSGGFDPILVPEENSTLRARDRYFQDHPPVGWRRLLPTSLQSPPGPIDDYAAVVLAEAYLEGTGSLPAQE